jgi:hypothetical protein
MDGIRRPALPWSGGCQCGTVRYEVRTEPLTLYACHCTDCQTQTGSAFALSMVVPRSGIATTSGEPQFWRRVHESGRAAECFFCPSCGTRLWHNPERNLAITILKPGTLDDTAWMRPVGHIWVRSAVPWIALPQQALLYPQQQPALDDMCAAWNEAATAGVELR